MDEKLLFFLIHRQFRICKTDWSSVPKYIHWILVSFCKKDSKLVYITLLQASSFLFSLDKRIFRESLSRNKKLLGEQ